MPYTDMDAKRVAKRAQRARWRQRRKDAGLPTHPERERQPGKPAPRRTSEGRKPAAVRPWLFIDTEGATDDGRWGQEGRQWTMCITAASDVGAGKLPQIERSRYHGRPLTTYELLDFIVRLPYGFKLGAFFFGYDTSQIVWQLPADQLRALYAGEIIRATGTDGGTVGDRAFWLQLFHTQLTVTSKPPAPDETRLKGRPIWDVGRIFGSGLLAAIETWQVATPAELQVIERWKARRSDFTAARWTSEPEQIIAYSVLENRLAARLQAKVDQTSLELGYPLKAWYGAGSLAKAMLAGHQLKPQTPRPVARRVAVKLPRAYYGGRFEIRRPGIVKPLHEYDLSSAYPAAYRELPCLEHGRWAADTSVTKGKRIGKHDLLTVSWHLSDRNLWGPFPTRLHTGEIVYRLSGSHHVVWGVEVQAARRVWPGRSIVAGSHLRYHRTCDCNPFDWVNTVYQRRVELGKSQRGLVLKLALNAVYGTYASTLGLEYDRKAGFSGWGEPRWASWITAWTRARMLEALQAAGGGRSSSVAMFATDAIYTTQPIPLDLTPGLGCWEHKTFDGGLLVRPGLYDLIGATLETKTRTRGVLKRDIDRYLIDLYDAWENSGQDPETASLKMTLSPRYMGVKLMLHRNKLDRAWRWETPSYELTFDPRPKRDLEGRALHGFGGSEPSPKLAKLILGLDSDIPDRPEDQVDEEIMASEQPEGGQ